jgi:hypothetical protein
MRRDADGRRVQGIDAGKKYWITGHHTKQQDEGFRTRDYRTHKLVL